MGDLLTQGQTFVDNAAHRLHHAGRIFPCDRDIEALQVWQEHALLLSSDTDCLSLYDGEGLLRMSRVGVYPQDMAVQEDMVYVCGGADGKVHILRLPDLTETAALPVPGMVERIAIHAQTAYVLTLLPDDPLRTLLLSCPFSSMVHTELARFAGIPGALAADQSGLWIGVSEQVLHLPHGANAPNLRIDGFGLPRRIVPTTGGALVFDELENQLVHCTMQGVTVLKPS